jgi:hypothetical protein
MFLVYTPLTRGPGDGILNTNFGWDSSGVWFLGDAGFNTPSYPIFTNFDISKNKKVKIYVDYIYNNSCPDFGLCFYDKNIIPEWVYSADISRIACSTSCDQLKIFGLDNQSPFSPAVLIIGNTYTLVITYDPTNTTSDNILFEAYLGNTLVPGSSITLSSLKINNDYKIGFCADQDETTRAYIKNLTININNGELIYTNTLQNITIPQA